MTEYSTVEANGLQFALVEEGEGPLVLMLHGFPDTAHTWDELCPMIAQAGFRVVSPFMRGYAPTQIPDEGPSARTLGEDALALIEALGEERAFVVGHDWGAVAAYAAASLGPERIRAMVVAAVPHPLAQTPSLALAWHVRHFLALNLPGAGRRIRRNDFAYLEKLYRRWSPTWDFEPSELDDVKASLGQPGSAEAAAAYYRMLRSGKPEELFYEKIEVSTIAVAPAEEPAITPEMFRAAARCFDAPYEVVEIPGGHFAHREHPDRFASIVTGAFGEGGA